MNSRTHLGLATLALSFATIGVTLGACSISDSPDPSEPSSTGGFEAPTVGTGGGGPGGDDGAGLGYGVGGGDGGLSENGSGGMGGAGGGDPLATEPPAECLDEPKNPRVVYLSADDSNSMGSPALARELINMGFEPNPRTIRTYEFLNYYQIAYDAPEYDQLAIYPHLEQKLDKPEIAELQIGVRSFNAFPTRRPMNITVIVDTSGSMKGPGLDRAKAAVNAMGTKFVQGDTISVVTWSKTPQVLDGHVITGPDDQTVQKFVGDLTAAGTTDLSTALSTAYEIARKHYDTKLMNRVVLISDGGVNAGISDLDYIAAQTEDADKEGIYLVGVGTGPALSYDDNLMNTITDSGRGAYVYLDSTEEATKIFKNRFDETMDIAARSVQVELTLPYYFSVEGISTEYVSPKPVTAQHLAPNDAMIFNLETTACHPEVYGYSDNIQVRVSWKTRSTYQERTDELKVPLNTLNSSPQLLKGRAIVAYAEALKGCYEDDGCTETKRKAVTKEKLVIARELATIADPSSTDTELMEIVDLIDRHPLFL